MIACMVVQTVLAIAMTFYVAVSVLAIKVRFARACLCARAFCSRRACDRGGKGHSGEVPRHHHAPCLWWMGDPRGPLNQPALAQAAVMTEIHPKQVRGLARGHIGRWSTPAPFHTGEERLLGYRASAIMLG